MTNRTRIVTGLLLTAAGVGLLLIRADRQFINLPPTPGVQYAIPLQADRVYSQVFVVHEGPVSRLGIYLRPLGANIPDLSVTAKLFDGDRLLHTQAIPAIFADPEAASAIRLSEPAAIATPGTLRLEVTVPTELSERVALQTRAQDETFNRDAVFTVDGEARANPLAYEVFAATRPSVTLHVGGLLLIGAVFLLTRLRLSSATGSVVYALMIVGTANAPAFVLGQFSGVVLIIQALLVFAGLRLASSIQLAVPARLLLAHGLAFTTWWPLVVVAGRPVLQQLPLSPGALAQIVFDPNQLALMYTGAYVGIPVAVVAALGLLWWKQGHLPRMQWLAIAFLIAGVLASPLLLAIGLMVLAAVGLQHLIVFLGEQNRLVRILAYAVVFIMLLDVLTVYARFWAEL